MEEAVAAHRAALEEWTLERAPLDWAAIQMNLGNALEMFGERQKSADLMEQAVHSMSGAVEVYQQAAESYWLPIAQARVTEMQAKLTELKRSQPVGDHPQ